MPFVVDIAQETGVAGQQAADWGAMCGSVI
jgi:hypothetical protein